MEPVRGKEEPVSWGSYVYAHVWGLVAKPAPGGQSEHELGRLDATRFSFVSSPHGLSFCPSVRSRSGWVGLASVRAWVSSGRGGGCSSSRGFD